ncbi:MAG: hypothetical protein ONB11_07195 [candidate division KSB1 bacterium]|nr:hypothetical protein [candidate division KSB1 bacterium]MDZ7342372.1 hypothetical protein [candidate division KSB1 bacterium]
MMGNHGAITDWRLTSEKTLVVYLRPGFSALLRAFCLEQLAIQYFLLLSLLAKGLLIDWLEVRQN